jgi:hypothetical protein
VEEGQEVMNIFADTYRLALIPQALAGKLIADADVPFRHLSRAKVVCVFSERALMLTGLARPAIVYPPTCQGGSAPKNFYEWALAMLAAPLFNGELPDFVIYFDRAIWDGLDDVRRERLVFHELKHIQQKTDDYGSPKFHRDTGEPILTLVPHDTELFDDELLRYGVEVCGAGHTAIAIAEGEAALRARTTPRQVA